MKFTVKDYQKIVEVRKSFNRLAYEWEQLGKIDKMLDCKKDAKKAMDLLEKFPKVSVKFYIGYRQYFQEVTKIGKTFFLQEEKMTKSRGYRNIEIIDEITLKMKQIMIADSYYY